MFGLFGLIHLAREGFVGHPEDQSIEDLAKLKTEFELKDIIINRNTYGGKMITAARKELERRGITLTESEKQQMEANKQKRIEEAKKYSKK